MKSGKRLRKLLINLQNKLGKVEGKNLWRQMKKENMNGVAP
jgi:hypothetical protein